MNIGLGIGIPFTRSQIWLAVQSFSPSNLFEDGTQGLWLDPSDLSTMFQDSGDTTGNVPVTAVEQPVGLILDKSGRGNHAYAPSDAERPMLKQDANGMYYLLFSGAQSMQTASINFTSTDKMFVSAGVRKLSAAVGGMIFELSSNTPLANGTFYLVPGAVTSGTGPQYSFGSRGTVFVSAESAASYAAPITNVLTGIGNISGDQSILRVNGTQAAINIADQGTGNYGNYPLYIGARAGTSMFFNGHLYQLVIAGKQASPTEITNTEQYVNSKTLALDWRDVTDSSSFRWNSATASPDAS